MTDSFFTPSSAAKAAHDAFKAKWKAASHAKRVSAADMAALAFHRAWWAIETQVLSREDAGAWIEARLDKAFTPVSNAIKLSNGADPSFSKKAAVRELKWQLTQRSRAHQKGQLDLPDPMRAHSGWDFETAMVVSGLIEVYSRQPAPASARKVAP